MDITPLIEKDKKIIQSYNTAGFKISGQFYEGETLVFLENVESWQIKEKPGGRLELDDFRQLLERREDLDLVLLGTEQVRNADRQLLIMLSQLREHGLRVEVMGTGAACRTFNVLMAEGRRVAAALIPDR